RRSQPTAGCFSTACSPGGCQCPSSGRSDAIWASPDGKVTFRIVGSIGFNLATATSRARGSELAEFPLSDRVSRLRPTAVNRVLHEARALQAQGRALISLMRGQPDTPTPGHIVEAAQKALRDGRTGYPDNQGEPALRRAVSDKLKREQGLAYDPDREILITDGATLGLCAALGALVDRGKSVLLPDPIYDAYE